LVAWLRPASPAKVRGRGLRAGSVSADGWKIKGPANERGKGHRRLGKTQGEGDAGVTRQAGEKI